MQANGDGQQSLAGAAAAADQPDNQPQIPVLKGETAAGNVTDVSHTSSTDNKDPSDYSAPATGDAGHYSQRTEGALLPNYINSGFPEQSPTDFPVQEGSEHGATGRASYQGGIVTENFEHCQGE